MQRLLRNNRSVYADGVYRWKKEKGCVHVHVSYSTWCSLHLHETSCCDQSLQDPDVMLRVHVRTADNYKNMNINPGQIKKDY